MFVLTTVCLYKDWDKDTKIGTKNVQRLRLNTSEIARADLDPFYMDTCLDKLTRLLSSDLRLWRTRLGLSVFF